MDQLTPDMAIVGAAVLALIGLYKLRWVVRKVFTLINRAPR